MSLLLFRALRRSFCTSQAASSEEVSSGFIRSLSNGVYKERSFKRMVEKLKQASKHYRFRTKTGIYVDAVRRLASGKRFDMIEDVLENQKKYNEISREGYTVRIITLYGKSGMFQHASKTFDEMPERKCDRTVLSFNALLGACVHSKKFDEAERIFKEYPAEMSIELDTVSYNTLMNGYCEKGSFDSAISMLDEMEKGGPAPDLVTFNTLMYHLYGNGRFSDGEKIWARMEAANVAPDVRSYTNRVEGLGTQKRMVEAVSLFEEMGRKRIKSDGLIYNALIKGFCNSGDLDEGMKWFDEMEKRIRRPGKPAFKNLILLACEKRDFDVAMKLCRKVFEHRCLIGSELLELVLDCFVKESRIDEAKELVELANSNDYCNKYKLKMPSE